MPIPTDTEIIKLLEKVDLFSGLENQELDSVAALCRLKSHQRGTVVLHQGELSDSFHIVKSGLFEVSVWDDTLKIDRVLDTIRPDEVFGEIGVLIGETRSASIRCRKKGETARFGREDFLAFLERNPRVSVNIARTLARRLRSLYLARRLSLERISNFPVTKRLIKLLPLQVMLRYRALPLRLQDDQVTIGLADPEDRIGRNVVAGYLGGFRIRWVALSLPDFERFRDTQLQELVAGAWTQASKSENRLVFHSEGARTETRGLDDLGDRLDDYLIRAIDTRASDLHFEPGPRGVAVRIRVDGKMADLDSAIPIGDYRPLVSRAKVVCDMNIAETRMPQGGAVHVQYRGRHLDMRVSTLPTPRGESLAIRILDSSQRKLDLASLVFSESVAEMIEELFLLPAGLALVTGPTGAGKTTTLYAGIHRRLGRRPADKLVTAEDPIEYEFSPATQVQVNEGIDLTFPVILRNLLRQDPDVILVGEARDYASLHMAFEAALTGHMVLSSLHTNDVLESLQRLRQLKIQPYEIAAALKGVVSQRLLPRNCPSCSEARQATPDELGRMRKAGILKSEERLPIFQAHGCEECKMTGTQGRVALFEVLRVSCELQDRIQHETPLNDLEAMVSSENFVSMRRYARILIEKGLAPLSEMLKVLPPITEDAS